MNFDFSETYPKDLTLSLKVKFSNSKLTELKSGIKYCTELTLKLSSNVIIGYSHEENNFRHKLSLTNIKLSKTQLYKTGQSWEFLDRLLGPLLKTGLPLMKNVLKPLAKSILIPLELTAIASAKDAAIHKKMFRFGMKTLIISYEEMNDIMKIVKSLK